MADQWRWVKVAANPGFTSSAADSFAYKNTTAKTSPTSNLANTTVKTSLTSNLANTTVIMSPTLNLTNTMAKMPWTTNLAKLWVSVTSMFYSSKQQLEVSERVKCWQCFTKFWHKNLRHYVPLSLKRLFKWYLIFYVVFPCLLQYMLPPPACMSGDIRACFHQQRLTHLYLDKMAAISPSIFSGVFSWMNSFVFWLKFHWSFLPRVQLTISQHWFR